MPHRLRLAAALLTLLVAAVSGVSGVSEGARAASLEGLAVDVKNESEPVLCAEKDNVAVAFSNKAVRAFRIEAVHPVYMSAGMHDSSEADWTACDMTKEPDYAPPGVAKEMTLYEEPSIAVIGYRFPNFWRKSSATVRIGDRVEENIHMLQVWVQGSNGRDEVLVLYPQDGYWRPRPFNPPNMYAPYGSSFLVGPIEYDTRPHVEIKDVAFDPEARRFTLTFKKGGTATVAIASVDAERIALDVGFDKGIAGQPFAMLRSMYITEFNNDTARIAVREEGAKGWREDNIMKLGQARATDIWIGRLTPSRHNTTSPDLVFSGFSDGATPRRPRNAPPPGNPEAPK